ncbi:MAG: hypothetical protein M1812_007059 [Candelaria pacifica]|nr:MAG: hypothetical protein M1812_007059 [Candelaria pacifica]
MSNFIWCPRINLRYWKIGSGLTQIPLPVHTVLPCRRGLSTPAKGPLPTKHRRWPYYVVSVLTGVGIFVTYTSWNESTTRGILQQQTFTPFTIIAKEAVSPTSTIFTLRPTNAPWSVKSYEHLWRQGVWSIQVKQPQLQIARAYTPLPPQTTSTGSGEKSNGFRFLIRKEDRGEVSTYLHKLPFGSTIELRGPNHEFDVPQGVDELVFLAGGTGIAAALQVAHAVLSQGSDQTGGKAPRIHIFWANRRREDCIGGINSGHEQRDIGLTPQARSQTELAESHIGVQSRTTASKKNTIVRELEVLKLKYPEQITMNYFVDEEGTFITGDSIKQCISSSSMVAKDIVTSAATKDLSKRLVMLSGPEGFISSLAGPKDWAGGKQVQGRLGGILLGLNLQGWTVWKL